MKSPYPTPESSQTMMWTPSPKASVTDWPCPDTDPLTSDEASFVPTPSPFDPFTTDTATTTPVSSVKRLTERFEAILPKPATPHTTRTPSRSSAPPAPVKLPRHAYVPAPAPTVPVESAPQDEPLSWTPAPFLGEPSLYHPLAQTPVTPHIPASRGVPPPPPPPPSPPAWFQPIQAPSSVSSVAVPDEPPQFRQLEMISAPEEAQYYQHATTTESVVDSVAEDSQTGDADSPNDDFAPAESTFFTETFGSVFDRIPDSSTTSGVSQMMNSLWKKDRVGLANESFQTELQQTHGDETDACVSPSSKSVGFSEASPKIHYVASSGTSMRSLDSKNRQSRRNVTKKGSVWAQGSVFVQEMYEQVLKTTTATGEIDDSMPPSVEKLLAFFSCDRGTVNHDSSSKSTTPTVPHSISKEDSNTEASFTDLINEKPTPAAKTAPIDWPQDFGFASGLSEVMRKNSHEDTPYDESVTPHKNNTAELLDLDWAVPPPANRDFEHHDHFSARSDPFVPRAIAARRTSSAPVKTKDPFWKNLEDPCDSPTDVVSGEFNRKDRNVVRANLATKFSPPPPLPRNETLSAFGIVESFSVRNSSEETYPDPSFALEDFADEEDCLFVIPPQLTNSRSLPHVRRNHVHLLEQEDDPFPRHSNLHLLEQEDADDETLSSGPSFSPAFVDAQFSF